MPPFIIKFYIRLIKYLIALQKIENFDGDRSITI